jgi:hypothetical protein
MSEQIKCKDVMSHICESLGEELQSEKCMAIKEHLQSCSCCQSYFCSVEQTIKFYKLYNINMPEEAHERLLHKLGLDDC